MTEAAEAKGAARSSLFWGRARSRIDFTSCSPCVRARAEVSTGRVRKNAPGVTNDFQSSPSCVTPTPSPPFPLHRLFLAIQPTLLLNTLLFPLSFAVNAAYQRRESALQFFGAFKACTLNLYLLHRCWQFEPDLPLDFLDCSRSCIRAAFNAVRAYLMARYPLQPRTTRDIFRPL